jgi:hypothetical protein
MEGAAEVRREGKGLTAVADKDRRGSDRPVNTLMGRDIYSKREEQHTYMLLCGQRTDRKEKEIPQFDAMTRRRKMRELTVVE